MPNDFPVAIVTKIGAVGVMEKGQEVGIQMQLEGNPATIIFAFRTEMLGASLPYISRAVEQANEEAGEEAKIGHFRPDFARVESNSDGSGVFVSFSLQASGVFRVELPAVAARELADALRKALTAGDS